MILKVSPCCSWCPSRCTLHPNDSLAMEGPLSRVKSLKKSLRQSFRRIRKSRVSGKKRTITTPTSKVSDGLSLAVRAPYRTSRLNEVVFVTVLCAGSGGQRCTSGAGGCGTGTAKDWTAVSGRLAVGGGPMPLLRWHLFTWRCVYLLMRISNKSGKMQPRFSIFHSINSIRCLFRIHQVRTTAPRFGRAPTRAVCTPTLWKCPVWARGAHASVAELARAACVWRRCWVKKSSWCTGPPWCPFVCWTAGGSRYQTHTKPPRTSPSRQIWPTLTLC